MTIPVAPPAQGPAVSIPPSGDPSTTPPFAEGTPGDSPPRSSAVRIGLGLVLAGWVAYATAWVALGDLRIFALRASVFDLGIFLEQGWQIYSSAYSPADVVFEFFRFGGNLVFWPVTLGGLWLMVAFQAVLLGAGGVLIYWIARRHRLPTFPATALAVIYYLYFPLAGVNFTDYHVEVFLIPLFLSGFLLFLQQRYRSSLVLLLLSGVLWYPLGIFPALFGLLLLLSSLASRRLRTRVARSHEHPSPVTGRRSRWLRWVRGWDFEPPPGPRPWWFSAGLLAGAILMLLGGTLVVAPSSVDASALAVAHATGLSPLANLPDKGLTLVLLFAPFAFLPLLSPRWLLFTAPYLGLVLTANYPGYTYPGLVTDWHAFLFIPFALLGAIDGLANLRSGTSWAQRLSRWLSRPRRRGLGGTPHPSIPDPTYLRPRSGGRGGPAVAVIGVALVLTVATSAFLTPYGPFNPTTSASFRTAELLNFNGTIYDEFTRLADLIPRGDPSVVFQDNMPELLPRPLMPGAIGPLVPGPFGGLAYNLTYPTAFGGWTPVHPDYVMGNPIPLPDSFFNSTGTFPFNLSLEEVLGHLYASGGYGVLGEAQGMWLIQADYHGAPEYYVPYASSFPPATFTSPRGTLDPPSCPTSCLLVSNLTNGSPAWFGPYRYLAPGSYNVTFRIGLEGWARTDSVTLDVTHHGGKQVLGSFILHGTQTTRGLDLQNITIPVTLTDGFASVEFRAVDSYFTGGLFLYSVDVAQTAPP